MRNLAKRIILETFDTQKEVTKRTIQRKIEKYFDSYSTSFTYYPQNKKYFKVDIYLNKCSLVLFFNISQDGKKFTYYGYNIMSSPFEVDTTIKFPNNLTEVENTLSKWFRNPNDNLKEKLEEIFEEYKDSNLELINKIKKIME